MLSPVSSSISSDAIAIMDSRQENNSQAISGKMDLLKRKLNSIDQNKTTHEIMDFKCFIERNEQKLIGNPAVNDKLLAALSVVNSISDNVEMGEDNTEKLSQLSHLMTEIEGMLNSGESESKSIS